MKTVNFLILFPPKPVRSVVAIRLKTLCRSCPLFAPNGSCV